MIRMFAGLGNLTEVPSFGFIGPSYQTRSINSDCERSINLYPEIVESGENASHGTKWVLYGTPGRQLFCTLDDGPVACVVSSNEQFNQFDVTPLYFVVSGQTLYSIAAHWDGSVFTGVPTTIGTVSKRVLTGGQLFPAQIIVLNPTLLFVVSNGEAFVAAYGASITSSAINQGGRGYAIGDTGIIVGSNGLDAKYEVTNVDTRFDGALITTGLASGGLNYAIGDTGTVDGGSGATYVITSVDIDGSVGLFGYNLTNDGSGYSVTTGATTTATSGSGTGLLIQVFAITTNGGAVQSFILTSAGSGYITGTDIATIMGGAQPGTGDGNFTVDITGVAAAAWIVEQQAIPAGTIFSDNFIQTCTFMDEYIIVSMAPTAADPIRRRFYISGVNRPSWWSPVDYGTKEANSDPIAAVFAAYEQLLVLGLTTVEDWYDNPNGAAFPFQRVQGGGVIEAGCASPWTIIKMDNTVCWLGTDNRGQLTFWELRGTTPIRISNHAVEYQWRNYDVTGASAYAYQEGGHYFGMVHFPIPDVTWCFDTATLGRDGKPVWHERLAWDGSTWHADIGRYHGFSFPVGHCVGDYNTSNLYLMSVDVFEDNCLPIRRLRVSPHIFDEQRRVLFSRFRLYAQTGIVPATGDGSAPIFSLRISNDGGYTWGPYLNTSAGLIGDFKLVIEWLRLGISRNRVWEVSTNEPIPIAWVDAFVEAIPTVTR